MELKKNPKKDLNRHSGLYFVAGMFLVLMLTYVALEWKSFHNNTEYDVTMNVQDELIEEVPLIEIKLPDPPKAPVAPEVIEIVKDDDPIIETIPDFIEPDPDTEITKVEDIPDVDEPIDVSVPFSVIENVPVFPGCENDSDKRACFNKMILKHVRKTFRYPEIAQEMGTQGKVYMNFVIQEDGKIGNVQIARSPDVNLGKEATRIINKLPQMIPGKQRGRAVKVPFSIPITFKLQ